MQRFLFAVAAALLVTVGSGGSALAGSKWCVVDPIVTVDGRTADVTVSFAETYVPSVTQPVGFRFHVPSNASASVTMPPAQVAYAVEVLYDQPARPKRDPVTVIVETIVPASSIFEVRTVVNMQRGISFSATGASNSVTTISYSVR